MLCHFRVGSGGASSRGIITSSSRTTVTRATSVLLVWGIVHIFHIDICYRYVWLYCFYVGWVLHLLAERIKCVFYFSELSFSVFVLLFSLWYVVLNWLKIFFYSNGRQGVLTADGQYVCEEGQEEQEEREGEREGRSGRRRGVRDIVILALIIH